MTEEERERVDKRINIELAECSDTWIFTFLLGFICYDVVIMVKTYHGQSVGRFVAELVGAAVLYGLFSFLVFNSIQCMKNYAKTKFTKIIWMATTVLVLTIIGIYA